MVWPDSKLKKPDFQTEYGMLIPGFSIHIIWNSLLIRVNIKFFHYYHAEKGEKQVALPWKIKCNWMEQRQNKNKK